MKRLSLIAGIAALLFLAPGIASAQGDHGGGFHGGGGIPRWRPPAAPGGGWRGGRTYVAAGHGAYVAPHGAATRSRRGAAAGARIRIARSASACAPRRATSGSRATGAAAAARGSGSAAPGCCRRPTGSGSRPTGSGRLQLGLVTGVLRAAVTDARLKVYARPRPRSRPRPRRRTRTGDRPNTPRTIRTRTGRCRSQSKAF